MIRTSFQLLALALSMILAQAATAIAAPPTTGDARPRPAVPKRVEFGYVGYAYIAPVYGCFFQASDDGSESATCVDSAGGRHFKPSYVRPDGTTRPWQQQFISGGRLVFTGPYGKGWQWVLPVGGNWRVMQARHLVTADYINTGS